MNMSKNKAQKREKRIPRKREREKVCFVVAVTVRRKSRGSLTLNLDVCRGCKSNFRDYMIGILSEETLTKRGLEYSRSLSRSHEKENVYKSRIHQVRGSYSKNQDTSLRLPSILTDEFLFE